MTTRVVDRKHFVNGLSLHIVKSITGIPVDNVHIASAINERALKNGGRYILHAVLGTAFEASDNGWERVIVWQIDKGKNQQGHAKRDHGKNFKKIDFFIKYNHKPPEQLFIKALYMI